MRKGFIMLQIDWERVKEDFNNGLDIRPSLRVLYTDLKIDQIILGLEKNIDVSIYANPELSAESMGLIIDIIVDGCPRDFVEIIVNSKFSEDQIKALVDGYKQGLTLVQFEMIADSRLSSEQMYAVIDAFNKGLPDEQVKKFIGPRYSVSLMYAIWVAILDGMSEEYLDLLRDPRFTALQVTKISRAFKLGLTVEQAEIVADLRLNHVQMGMLLDLFNINVPLEAIKFVKSLNWSSGDWDEWDEAIRGFESDLSLDEVRLYVGRGYHRYEMKEIREKLIKEKSMRELLSSLFDKSRFNLAQLDIINNAINKGLSAERIKVIANPNFSPKRMEKILEMFKFGLSNEQVELLTNPSISLTEMQDMLVGQQRVHLFEEQFKEIDWEEVKKVSRENNYCGVAVYNRLDVLKNIYDVDQVCRIVEGIKENLNILLYINPEFSKLQMEIICKGLRAGMSTRHILKFADPVYSWLQMEQIFLGLLDGVDVSVYADPRYNWKKMQRERERLA